MYVWGKGGPQKGGCILQRQSKVHQLAARPGVAVPLCLLLLLLLSCSPSLSSSEVFQVDAVEAWQLMPPQEDTTAGHKAGQSHLVGLMVALQIRYVFVCVWDGLSCVTLPVGAVRLGCRRGERAGGHVNVNP